MPNILVTGGAGYIGSHTVWQLRQEGFTAVVADDLSKGHSDCVPRGSLHVCSLFDRAQLAELMRVEKIDAVIHFAAFIAVGESTREPERYFHNNVAGSISLFSAMADAGVDKLVFSSTAAVYGTPDGTEPVLESAALRPESPYGSSKLMTEIMLRDTAAAHDFTYTALRYFNVAGADPRGRTGQSTAGATHLIKVASEAALGKRAGMDVFGTDYPTPDGTCVRDYIHVSDLANAHLKALQRMRAGGGSIVANCGYGRGFSVLEVLEQVKTVSGRDFPVRFAPRRPGDAVLIVANPSVAMRELGWTPEHDNLGFIVRTALDWEEHLGKRNQI